MSDDEFRERRKKIEELEAIEKGVKQLPLPTGEKPDVVNVKGKDVKKIDKER